MTSKVPQIIVTLTPEGHLAVELPGTMATRRQIEIKTEKAGETLLRILSAQAREQAEIGLDGAPTAAQVKHWERHHTFPDPQCRFCLAEKRVRPQRIKRSTTEHRSDGVEIKRFTEKGKIKLDIKDLEIEF